MEHRVLQQCSAQCSVQGAGKSDARCMHHASVKERQDPNCSAAAQHCKKASSRQAGGSCMLHRGQGLPDIAVGPECLGCQLMP